MTAPDNEVGRELAIADLKPQQVVVIQPPHRDNVLITVWVEAVDATAVTFFAGEMKWHIINFIKDGQIVDDRDRVVRVFEYLGEV
jgi:hypothetical protein